MATNIQGLSISSQYASIVFRDLSHILIKRNPQWKKKLKTLWLN